MNFIQFKYKSTIFNHIRDPLENVISLFVESTLYILYLMARQSSKTFSCVLSSILSFYKNHSKIEMEYDWYYIKACLDTYFFQYVKVTFYVLLPWESERSFWKKCHPVCLSGEVFIKICSKKFIAKDLLSQSQFSCSLFLWMSSFEG